MPFPLPTNPEFRKVLIWDWIQDAADHLESQHLENAEISWRIAREIYLSLPPGEGCKNIEVALYETRGKIDEVQNS